MTKRKTTGALEEIFAWRPNPRVKKQYGWVYTWLYPLNSYLDQHLGEPLSPDLRNRIHDIVTAIISQLAIEGKYGIKIPHNPYPSNAAPRVYKPTNYDPCLICEEDRITHDCHIIPRSEGGPGHRANLIPLCPLHHHLFDHARLARSEWEALLSGIKDKSEAARAYAREVRLPLQENYWEAKQ